MRWVAEEQPVGEGQWRALRRRRGAAGTHEEDRILERTTHCLTTPYDRELVACVIEGAAVNRCVRAFAARRRAAEPGPAALPL